MKRLMERALLLAVYAFFTTQASASGEQQFAEFSKCPLLNGESIVDCRIGYRTFGKLNADRSNAILFPSWFVGTSEDFVGFGYIGPGQFADSDRYFIIAVDAFSNGVSSSPSNSTTQSGRAFPDIRIEDMVDAQYRLLTDVLHIQHLHAVIGISMGGMQALQWAVRYPDFMDNAVSVIGTPVQTSYDLLLWNAQLQAINSFADHDYEATVHLIAALDNLVTYTPQYIVRNIPVSDYQAYINGAVASIRQYGLQNRVPQLRAMIRHDISSDYGGSMQKAADRLQARLLIVVSPQDHMVTPQPSKEFSQMAGAAFHELPGDCGHIAVACEKDELTRIVSEFLGGGD
ncbi:MAG: alpha/beta fold hydrolase [Gammaproteobacteria bacterium]|nr:alpha/beta fold hydrolase [Gammaproteobacteria bacterium]MDH4314526.1 alpha/beta fold hydrolase [Gammaproteobacteria bacterium]MDH5214590.1 alpha/beta fold hydrolase [Gammaproteobacteria bacterium]MDH5500105.1 alpha/beta fold hydrolase [Gammaproteobacteria bacterium]